MKPLKSYLLSCAVAPAVLVAVGLVAGCGSDGEPAARAQAVAANPCAAKRNPCAAAANPCAAKANPCGATAQLAQRAPCNPCAAANPCAAKRNPCNPCATKNPCNPCAAANPCNPSNPCAATAKLSDKCVVPRLRVAAAGNPCKPCNPCAAKANPCAARNPCNPCAAKAPCNPCGAAASPAELRKSEAVAVYNCLKGEMDAAYGQSGNRFAQSYTQWTVFNAQPYVSATHGERYVNNYANAKARAYGKFEKAGRMPVGAVLAKNSFTVNAKGQAGIGPLFLMEKMPAGFSRESDDWRYTMIMPTGAVLGATNGPGSANVKFCIECHAAVAQDRDSMMFMPEEARRR